MWAIQPGPAAMRRALPSGRSYTQKMQALGPIAYYPQAEPSGTTIGDESGNGRNGTYVGVTLGQPGMGDGRTAAGYDGVTSYGNIYSASLAGAWNGAEGTIVTGARVPSAGVWTDGVQRFMAIIGVNLSTNYVAIYKRSVNNSIEVAYVAGGVVKATTITMSATTWQDIAVTWSKVADEMRVYVNGVQVGAPLTGLGTWSGVPISTRCVLGAAITTPANVHNGLLAHTAIFNRALSAAEIASLAVVP